MSNGTTNVDQANFYAMSTNRGEKEFEVIMAEEYPDNIDPKVLGEMFDKKGSISIKTEKNGQKEKIALIRKGILKESKNKGNVITH